MQAGLSADGTVEQIRSIVEILVSLSAEGQSEAEALRAELKDAQTQALTLRRKLVKVEKLATLDPLTSLPNRRHFDEYIDAAVTESHDDFTPLSVVMIDIDHFKRINDSFGHPTGDAVLKQMASLIAKSVRSNDLVARFGGEEFVLVLKKTAKGDARQIAERIRTNILAENWVNPKSNAGLGKVTASFGIAEIIDNEEPDGLVARADKQLYSAKKLGRNRVEMDMTR
ncbi:MAG: GGDEF domain-containing protein [Hyphomicrobium sp.]